MTTQLTHQIGAPPAKRGRLDERQLRFLFFLTVVILAALVRWLFLNGPAGSDDTRYMDAAVALANGEPPARLDHANVRASFLVWLASWSWLGLSASQLVYSQIAASAIQAGALFWVARMLTNDWSALIAATLWVFFPIELVYGGVLTPDQLSMAFGLISLAFLIRGLRDHTTPDLGHGLLAGVAAALAYSAKEPFFLLVPVFGAWSASQIGLGRRAWRWHSSMALGFFIVIVLEHAFYAAWTGDWLYKYSALLDAYGPGGGWQSQVSASALTYYPRLVLANFAISGFFGWLLLVGALVSAGKVRHWALILGWSIVFFAFLQFGSTSIREYTPLPMQARYAGPIVVLLFVPLGLTVLRMATESPLRRIGTLILFSTFVVHGTSIARERIASGLYLSNFPASATALLHSPEIQNRNVLVPGNFHRRLPVDLRLAAARWQEVKVRELVADPSRLREACPCVILLPEMPATGARRRQFEDAGLRTQPLEVPITPLDVMLDRAPVHLLKARALKRLVADVYIHSPDPGPEASH